ncbi:MAG: hypothetical protein HC854_17635 [Flavobacterium sp.]|nr:hypothetical protein [Flavobacterium sp.]
MDLIERVYFLKSKGDKVPYERFVKWLEESESEESESFIVNNQMLFWKIISSKSFIDVIDEDITNWFYIHNIDFKLRIIAKVWTYQENLLGERNGQNIFTLWILNSNIISIKVDEIPKHIHSPHRFDSPTNKGVYDLKKLIEKLNNPKVKLTEFIVFKRSKEFTRRLR